MAAPNKKRQTILPSKQSIEVVLDIEDTCMASMDGEDFLVIHKSARLIDNLLVRTIDETIERCKVAMHNLSSPEPSGEILADCDVDWTLDALKEDLCRLK